MCGDDEVDVGGNSSAMRMIHQERNQTLRTLTKRCRGKESCSFMATESSLGNVWGTENSLALSVIATCLDSESATAGWATEVKDMFGDGCANG